MDLREYQEISKRTLNKDLTERELIANMTMGISGEFGEAIDVVKKHMYQGHVLNMDKLIEELGDGMWYVVNLCNLLDIDMRDVLSANYDKLMERYPKGFDVERSVNRGR